LKLFVGQSGVCVTTILFLRKKQYTFMQATFRGIYWLRFWAWLQHEVEEDYSLDQQSIGGYRSGHIRQQRMKKQ
jgi:hypothetical protein